jgi:hypothetical protein
VEKKFALTFRMVGFPEAEVLEGVYLMPEAFARAKLLSDTGEVFETTVAPADLGDYDQAGAVS